MNQEQIGKSLAFELGSAVEVVKYAYEQPTEAACEQVLSKLTPDHIELVQRYQAAVNQRN